MTERGGSHDDDAKQKRRFALAVFRLAEALLIAEGREVTPESIGELVDALAEPSLRKGLIARVENYPAMAPTSAPMLMTLATISSAHALHKTHHG